MVQDDDSERLRELEKEVEKLRGQVSVEKGIKGWLILHAIGNVVGSVVLGFMALGALLDGPPPLVTVIVVSCFLYVLYYTVIFFQHKKSVPTHAKVLCVLSCIGNLIYLGNEGFGRMKDEQLFGILVGVMFAVVWFVYYGVSKRVKATFVEE
jgi:drug/metabolite transporter (DMT)-like permease